MAFVELIEVSRCRPNGGTFVTHGDRELAVFLLSEPERIAVVDNACPHASGNLSGGELAGHIVTCPWHHWKFDLDRGVCTHSPLATLRTYIAEVREGAVWADLDAPGAIGSGGACGACSSAVRAGDS